MYSKMCILKMYSKMFENSKKYILRMILELLSLKVLHKRRGCMFRYYILQKVLLIAHTFFSNVYLCITHPTKMTESSRFVHLFFFKKKNFLPSSNNHLSNLSYCKFGRRHMESFRFIL